MRNRNRKLCSSSGETLTETLCALLIIAIASAVFATMINAAIDRNHITETQNDTFYQAVTAMESGSDTASAETTIETSGKTSVRVWLNGRSTNFPITTCTFTDEAADHTLTTYLPVTPVNPNGEGGEGI